MIVAYGRGPGPRIQGPGPVQGCSGKIRRQTTVIQKQARLHGRERIGWTELSKGKPDSYTIGFINLPPPLWLSGQGNASWLMTERRLSARSSEGDRVVVVRKRNNQFNSLGSGAEYARPIPKRLESYQQGAGLPTIQQPSYSPTTAKF